MENNYQNEQTARKKYHLTIWHLVLAVVIALTCGYFGTYLANEQAGKVVIQKVSGTSGSAAGDGQSAVEIAQEISPTVVSITPEKMEVNNFWFGTQISSGADSGVIISEDGYILTCAHVVSGADSIQVTTSSGDEYSAVLVGSYENGDIAVLKVEATGLQPAMLGDSGQIQLAERVYAVGNPGGTLSYCKLAGSIGYYVSPLLLPYADADEAHGS